MNRIQTYESRGENESELRRINIDPQTGLIFPNVMQTLKVLMEKSKSTPIGGLIEESSLATPRTQCFPAKHFPRPEQHHHRRPWPSREQNVSQTQPWSHVASHAMCCHFPSLNVMLLRLPCYGQCFPSQTCTGQPSAYVPTLDLYTLRDGHLASVEKSFVPGKNWKGMVYIISVLDKIHG